MYFVIERFEGTELPCRNYDVGAGHREPQRHGPAYAARRARDECDASGQGAIRHTRYLIAISLIGWVCLLSRLLQEAKVVEESTRHCDR